MNLNIPTCIICKSNNLIKHHYKPNFFNEKLFYYFLCIDCKSLSINPTPSKSDFDDMYGVIDHGYFAEENKEFRLESSYSNLEKYTHHRYEIDYFDKIIKSHDKAKTLLDFACGSGFYLQNAISQNIASVGIELTMILVKL